MFSRWFRWSWCTIFINFSIGDCFCQWELWKDMRVRWQNQFRSISVISFSLKNVFFSLWRFWWLCNFALINNKASLFFLVNIVNHDSAIKLMRFCLSIDWNYELLVLVWELEAFKVNRCNLVAFDIKIPIFNVHPSPIGFFLFIWRTW